MTDTNVLDDATAIRMVLQRLCAEGKSLVLAHQANRSDTVIIAEDGRHLLVRMEPAEIGTWGLRPSEKVTLKLEDRGFKYETVVDFAGPGPVDTPVSWSLSLPRVLRRTDGQRMAAFVPDDPPRATFTNARDDLLDGFVRGFGSDGLELALRDPSVKPTDVMKMGEKSTLDVPLGKDLRLMAPTTVSYFGDDFVGLKFDKDADKALLGKYRTWLSNQQQLQAERDKQRFQPGGVRESVSKANKAAVLPGLRILHDKDPLLLLLSEKADVAQRLADTFSRRYGTAYLDYIKGPLRSQLGEIGGPEWGRLRMILIHNQLRLSSPLEVCRNLTGREQCPVPVVLLGNSEDEGLKRKRAQEAGALDFIAIEPFRPLTLLRRLEEILRLKGPA